jgi:hypothetical protein
MGDIDDELGRIRRELSTIRDILLVMALVQSGDQRNGDDAKERLAAVLGKAPLKR